MLDDATRELTTGFTAWLAEWADARGCEVVQGECGFGRPCVGLRHRDVGDQWVLLQHYQADYTDAPDSLPWQDVQPPTGVETFSKTPLLVVMIEGIEDEPSEHALALAYIGLVRWALQIERAGQTIKVVPKMIQDVSSMLGARTEAILAASE